MGEMIYVLGESGSKWSIYIYTKNIRFNHFKKLMLKLASLVARKSHVIEIYIYFQNFS